MKQPKTKTKEETNCTLINKQELNKVIINKALDEFAEKLRLKVSNMGLPIYRLEIVDVIDNLLGEMKNGL